MDTTNHLPFQVGDLVRRTAVDYCPELDASEGITEGMVGKVAGIDYSTPMFNVHFGGDRWGLYLTDELEKVGS